MTTADAHARLDYDRGSTTEVDTPSSIEPGTASYVFARLIPTNRPAREAVERTRAQASQFHADFIGTILFRDQETPCFLLSLDALPEFPSLGWRIGRGRDNIPNRGVDLLLCGTTKGDHVAGIHARFNFVKGAAGFFLIADNARGKPCTINGDDFANDRRPIPYRSTITLGECAFTLHYVARHQDDENKFQLELRTFYKLVLADENPFVLPTPRETDSRFGDWIVQYPISKGTYGTVFLVTHAAHGRLAAAKQLVKTRYNARKVEHEVTMAEIISKLSHSSIAIPFEIRHNPCRSEVELARIKTLLGGDWDPNAQGDITDEYIIFSPLLNATFRSIIDNSASIPISRLELFFCKLLDGVAFLHDQGLCHRDIKPVNILIRSFDPPEALICDFGCLSDKSEIMYDSPGTVPYLAPEQRKGLSHDPTVDYWACGLVGYELLTGEVTQQRVEPGAMLEAYHRKLDAIGSVMAKCCRNMLDAEPTLRMPAKDAAEALRSATATKDNSDGVTPTSKRKKLRIK